MTLQDMISTIMSLRHNQPQPKGPVDLEGGMGSSSLNAMPAQPLNGRIDLEGPSGSTGFMPARPLTMSTTPISGIDGNLPIVDRPNILPPSLPAIQAPTDAFGFPVQVPKSYGSNPEQIVRNMLGILKGAGAAKTTPTGTHGTRK